MKVLKGSVVKLDSGSIGMIVYKKSNEDMAINIQHYHLAMNRPDYNEDDRQKMLQRIKQGCCGSDKEISKSNIVEVISL